MNYKQAVNVFRLIRDRYHAIPSPKYRHADLEILERYFKALQDLKVYLYDHAFYSELMNGIGQTIARIKRTNNNLAADQSSAWKNISEHGFNKVVRPFYARYHEIDGGFGWQDKYGEQSIICRSNFTANHFIVIDVIAYFFMLQLNNNKLPVSCEPVFSNHQAIQNFLNDPLSVLDVSMVEVQFNDLYFRKYSGLDYPSNKIYTLIDEVADCEFKLSYPLMLIGENGGKKESPVKMQSYSKLFNLTMDEKKRSDGNIAQRVYSVSFATTLGMLFIHNLKMKNYGFINNMTYGLNPSAQIFYRKFILSNNNNFIQINLGKITADLNFTNSNKKAVQKTIKENILAPLKESSLITDFEFQDGSLDKKVIIKIQR